MIVSTSEVLDRLAPVYDFAPDWEDVLARAGVSRRPTRRLRLVLTAVLLVTIVVPLTAIAESRDWWFFSNGAPAPATDVFVVKTGEWDGTRWELVAYRTVNRGLCFSLSRAGSKGRGPMNCDQIVGVTPESEQLTPKAIAFLSAGPSAELPAYVAGAVTDEADEVAIYFVDDRVVRTETFAAPDALGAIRFFAARPQRSRLFFALPGRFVDKIEGIDADGRVVACLDLPLPPAERVPRLPCP